MNSPLKYALFLLLLCYLYGCSTTKPSDLNSTEPSEGRPANGYSATDIKHGNVPTYYHVEDPMEYARQNEIIRRKLNVRYQQKFPGDPDTSDVPDDLPTNPGDLPTPPTDDSGLDTLANGKLIGKWHQRGGYKLSGRAQGVFYKKNTDELFVTTAGGHVFLSSWEGNNWKCLNDKFRIDDIRVIKVVDLSGGKTRIMAGTKNQNFYYSDDYGKNWLTSNGLGQIGKANWAWIDKVVFTDDASSTIYLLARAKDVKDNKDKVTLYRSTDLGSSFSFVYAFDPSIYGIKYDDFDLWAPLRQKNAIAYVLAKKNLFRLIKGGKKMGRIGSIPSDSAGVKSLTGTLANSSLRLYAKISSEFWRSADGGKTWAKKGLIDDDPFQDYSFSCATTKSDALFFAKNKLKLSINGGKTWTDTNSDCGYGENPEVCLHDDFPGIFSVFGPDDREYIFACNDAGVAVSDNFGVTFKNLALRELNCARYYGMLTIPEEPDYLYVGSQDQGCQRTNYVSENAESQLAFIRLTTGDHGYPCTKDVGNTLWFSGHSSISYFLSPKINSSNKSLKIDSITPQFIPYTIPHPTSNKKVYIAGRSLDGNVNSAYIVEARYESSKIKLRLHSQNFWPHSNASLSAFQYSPINTNEWYAITNDGSFFFSTSNGEIWKKSTALPGPIEPDNTGATILCSNRNNQLIFVAGKPAGGSSVWRSINKGKQFLPLGTGLPTCTVYSLTFSLKEDLLFAATDIGPWVYVVADDKWYAMEGRKNPDVVYRWVEYVAALKTIRFATFGRGVWDFKLHTP